MNHTMKEEGAGRTAAAANLVFVVNERDYVIIKTGGDQRR